MTANLAVDTARVALRLSAVATGVFFLAVGRNKLQWIAHPDLLSHRLEQWLPRRRAVRNAKGPLLFGILLALAIAGRQLPFSISALRMKR